MKNNNRAYLYLLITFFTWGSLYVVSKFVLDKIPVITLSFLRYIVASAVLFIMLKRKTVKKIAREDYKYVFLIGFLGYFVAIGLQLLGTKWANASLAALVNSMNPIVIMLFAVFILKEKLTIKKILCGFLAIAGVYIVLGGATGNGQTIGIAVSIASVILWSWIAVFVRKITQKYDALQITTYGIITAAACTFPFSVWELANSPQITIETNTVLSILYIGLMCTALSHFLWNKSLSMLEASTCSMFYPLQPLTAVLLGWVFLGESINLNFIAGTMLIVSGVLISIYENRQN